MKRFSAVASAVALVAVVGVAVGPPATAKAKPHRKHPPSWSLPGHGGFAFGFGSAWIAGGGTVLRVNPRTNRVMATIANAGSWPIALSDGIWTIENFALDHIDPRRNKVVSRIPLATSTESLAYGFGSFWITTNDGTVARVDPAAEKVVATISVQDAPNWSPMIAAGEGAVWVASADKHMILKIDPTSNTVVSSTPVGDDDSLLTVSAAYGSVWAHENAAAQGRGLLYRIDPATGTVISTLTTSPHAGGSYGGTDLAFGAGSIWASNGNGTVSRITPDGTRVIKAVATPFLSEFIAVGLGSVWVQSDSGEVVRIPLAKFTR